MSFCFTSHHDSSNPPFVGPTPADVLRTAATYLQRHGWVQGRYYANLNRPHPKACALGAIAITVHGDILLDPNDGHLDTASTYHQAITVLARWLTYTGNATRRPVPGFDTPSRQHVLVSGWNDHPHQTVTHVVAALHAAATWWHHTHTPTPGREQHDQPC